MYCHLDPQVFPDPTKFKPKRWANASSEMEKRLVPFSKGKRMCPGKEISIMELYIVFAALFRKYKVEVHDTTYVFLTVDLMREQLTDVSFLFIKCRGL